MPSLGPAAVAWLTAGGFVALLGGLVRFAGSTWLVAGYSESSAEIPDDVVRILAGNALLRVGFAVAAVGALETSWRVPSLLVAAVVAVILLETARLVYRLNALSPAATE